MPRPGDSASSNRRNCPLEPMDPQVTYIQPGGGVVHPVRTGLGRLPAAVSENVSPGLSAADGRVAAGGRKCLSARSARPARHQISPQSGRLVLEPGGRSLHLAGPFAVRPVGLAELIVLSILTVLARDRRIWRLCFRDGIADCSGGPLGLIGLICLVLSRPATPQVPPRPDSLFRLPTARS